MAEGVTSGDVTSGSVTSGDVTSGDVTSGDVTCVDIIWEILVGAVPRMHAQAPQVPTGCWPGSRGISASSCSQPAAPKTA